MAYALSLGADTFDLLLKLGGLLTLATGVAAFVIAQRDRVRQHACLVTYELTQRVPEGTFEVDVTNHGSAPITRLHCRLYKAGHLGDQEQRIGQWCSAIVVHPEETRRALIVERQLPLVQEIMASEADVEVIFRDVNGRWWSLHPEGRPQRSRWSGERLHQQHLDFEASGGTVLEAKVVVDDGEDQSPICPFRESS